MSGPIFTTVDAELPRPIDTPLEQLEFAVLDLETTGTDFEQDRIVEIGIVRCDQRGTVLGEFETLVSPEGVDVGASEIHGLTSRSLEGAPAFAELHDLLAVQLAGAVMVAHNAFFERGFLNASFFRDFGRRLSVPYICSMQFGRFVPAGGAGSSLRASCEQHGIELTDAHQALADARATAALLGAQLESVRTATGRQAATRLRDLPLTDQGDPLADVRRATAHDGYMAKSWRRPLLAAPEGIDRDAVGQALARSRHACVSASMPSSPV